MKSGCVMNVLFRIVGDDDLIPTLSEKVGGTVDSRVTKGKIRFGSPAPHHFISIRINDGEEKQQDAVCKTTEWLRQHKLLLAGLSGDKWIEFSTYTMPEQAYESLAFSKELMQSAIDADCRLHNTCYAGIMQHDSMWRRKIGE